MQLPVGAILVTSANGGESPSFTSFSRYSPLRFVSFSPIALGGRPAYNRPTLAKFLSGSGRRKVSGLRLAGFGCRKLVLRSYTTNEKAPLRRDDYRGHGITPPSPGTEPRAGHGRRPA